MLRSVARLLIPLAGVLFAAASGRAQTPDRWDASRLQMTREGLGELLAQYEDAARSSAYSAELRARARYEAALIRTRLEEGDFQIGDRIVLVVEGEEALSDSFTVQPGIAIDLPTAGRISLRGVLRSELEGHLHREVSRLIREPVVRAHSMIRIAVFGSVGSPGFFVVPTTALLTDILMQAGGPAPDAQLDRIRVERGEERIWDGAPMQEAIIEGRTLDQLSLRAGDRIVVPRRERRDWFQYVQFTMLVIPAIIGFRSLF